MVDPKILELVDSKLKLIAMMTFVSLALIIMIVCEIGEVKDRMKKILRQRRCSTHNDDLPNYHRGYGGGRTVV